MISKIKNFLNSSRRRQLTDPRNIGLYIFALIVLAVTWSGAKTVQTNYQLQKQISVLKQQNAITSLQNQNAKLQNQYYQTDQYLELAARQDFGLAAPGEKALLVPSGVALKYIDKSLVPAVNSTNLADQRSKYIKNMEDWRDFLLGRKLYSN